VSRRTGVGIASLFFLAVAASEAFSASSGTPILAVFVATIGSFSPPIIAAALEEEHNNNTKTNNIIFVRFSILLILYYYFFLVKEMKCL
jgi:hypothetical protein